MEDKGQSIVFAFWVNSELKGFRADTFNTITQDRAKIYTYTPQQVKIVLDGVRSACNRDGTRFMKKLMNISNVNFVNADPNDAVDQISSSENTLREWREFEVRVHPFLDKDETGSYPERWKIQAAIASLEDAIEVHKFMIVDNEN
jgi:hypothetical protein